MKLNRRNFLLGAMAIAPVSAGAAVLAALSSPPLDIISGYQAGPRVRDSMAGLPAATWRKLYSGVLSSDLTPPPRSFG